MRRGWLGALVACVTLGGAAAQAETVATFRLDNGLDVVVIEDRRAPVVTHMVWYRVGAADEPAGKSGIAHYLEHLMFKGTDTLAPGAFSAIVEANGGRDNAFTSWDYTGYFQRVAADRLELMMRLEADRMANLAIPEAEALTERDVILEERGQVVESRPGAVLGEQMRAAQFLNHPYGIPIIGWRHEIEALTREDALAFYRLHYAPNNATLIVAGDVEPEAVRALAEAQYGPVAPRPLPPRIRPAEPPQLAERRVIYRDARVAQPYIARQYLAPARHPGDQAAAAALTVLAELLGGTGATSVLGRAMEFGSGSALYTNASYRGIGLDHAVFSLAVVPAEGVDIAAAEAEMDRVIAAFLRDGPDPAQFERIRMRLRAAEIYARDDVDGLARDYGEALSTGLTVADVQGWPAALQAVTPADVMAAAARVLDRRQSVTGWLLPPEATEVSQ